MTLIPKSYLSYAQYYYAVYSFQQLIINKLKSERQLIIAINSIFISQIIQTGALLHHSIHKTFLNYFLVVIPLLLLCAENTVTILTSILK